MEYNVIRAFTHYAFNPSSLVNSMAILRVSPDVSLGLTPTIATACLSCKILCNWWFFWIFKLLKFWYYSATLITSARCWVAGYGQGAFGSTSTQSILQQVEIPLVDQTTCQNQLRTTRLGSGFILDPTRWVEIVFGKLKEVWALVSLEHSSKKSHQKLFEKTTWTFWMHKS